MTTQTLSKLDEIQQKRETTVRRKGYEIIESQVSEESGAGVVIARSRFMRDTTTAFWFKPRSFNRVLREERIQSNHERRGALKQIEDSLAETKRLKKAPHDLAVGDVLAEIWGYSLQGVRFWRVIAIPTPRKVTVAALPSRIASGDTQNGTRLPDLDAKPEPGQVKTLPVTMASGKASIQGSTSRSFAKWSGAPIHVYTD